MKNHTLSMLQQDLSQFTSEELEKNASWQKKCHVSHGNALFPASQAFAEEFDVREYWPECKPITTHVRYQTCNNCWSHATALITESRLCIQSRGKCFGSLLGALLYIINTVHCKIWYWYCV